MLADAVWYTQTEYKPRLLVDLATLTGAIIVALGHEFAGLFADDEKLAQRLLDAGTKTGEKLWRMPLADAYDKDINCDIADVKNTGSGRATPGSATAAHFIKRFIKDTPWAHLDIAGMAWTKADTGITPKGATAFGVRLLNRFVADHYEGK